MRQMQNSLRKKGTVALALIVLIIFYFRVQRLLQQQITSAIKEKETEKKSTAINQITTDTDFFPDSQIQSTERREAKKYYIPSSYDPSFIHPGWTCSSPARSTSTSASARLIFVHVFKTAGSTFRTFFHSYGEKCGKGVSTIIQCSYLSSASLESSNPDESWKPDCKTKWTLTREKKTIRVGKRVTRAHLQKQVDIAIGHFPLGIHENWVDNESNEQITPQYIAFFREPFAKYVSGVLFHHKKKHWTFKQAVKEIKADIRFRYEEKDYYNAYKRYLSTPKQKEEAKKKKLSNDQWNQIVKQNIIDMHVIVGLVENMGESVGLIQSIIDTDEELTDDFRKLVHPSDSGSLVKNQSKLSSSKITAALKDDEKTWKMFNEILKYEVELYNFAMEVHGLQVKEMKKRHGDRYSFVTP